MKKYFILSFLILLLESSFCREIFLELFIIWSRFHYQAKFSVICRLGHLAAYPQLYFICEQIEKHPPNPWERGVTTFLISL